MFLFELLHGQDSDCQSEVEKARKMRLGFSAQLCAREQEHLDPVGCLLPSTSFIKSGCCRKERSDQRPNTANKYSTTQRIRPSNPTLDKPSHDNKRDRLTDLMCWRLSSRNPGRHFLQHESAFLIPAAHPHHLAAVQTHHQSRSIYLLCSTSRAISKHQGSAES